MIVLCMLLSVLPVHGVVLDALNGHTAIVRVDPVTSTMPAQIRRFALAPPQRPRTGTGLDALYDPSSRPATLRDTVPAGPFAPGLPDAGRVVPIEPGHELPPATLVDQNARLVSLDRAFRGKTLLLSFVFTRCPDRTLCPAISGKYSYLQDRLDPQRFALAEITLDPPYDSPAVLRAYAKSYGARAANWKLLTGTGSTIQRLLDEFRISSMRLSSDNFLHDDKLFIVAPNGRVAYVVDTADWDPRAMIAQANAVAGLASNPFERFKLALIAQAIAICGGSEFAGIALLELTLFTLLTVVSFLGMWLVARVIWGKRAVP